MAIRSKDDMFSIALKPSKRGGGIDIWAEDLSGRPFLKRHLSNRDLCRLLWGNPIVEIPGLGGTRSRKRKATPRRLQGQKTR